MIQSVLKVEILQQHLVMKSKTKIKSKATIHLFIMIEFISDTLDKLTKCKSNIETACFVPEVNETQLENCKESAKKIIDDLDSCFQPLKDDDEACSCLNELNLDSELELIGDCDTKTENDKVLDEMKICKKSKIEILQSFQ